MIKLNNYINEAWSGVQRHTNNAEIEAWCEEMGIEDYTINSLGEISVNGNVDLSEKDFKELPYKFDRVNGRFKLSYNKKLTSLKNCPNYVRDSFACDFCTKLDSLEGCPTKVGGDFHCYNCKKKFTEKEVKRLCKVKKIIFI